MKKGVNKITISKLIREFQRLEKRGFSDCEIQIMVHDHYGKSGHYTKATLQDIDTKAHMHGGYTINTDSAIVFLNVDLEKDYDGKSSKITYRY